MVHVVLICSNLFLFVLISLLCCSWVVGSVYDALACQLQLACFLVICWVLDYFEFFLLWTTFNGLKVQLFPAQLGLFAIVISTSYFYLKIILIGESGDNFFFLPFFTVVNSCILSGLSPMLVLWSLSSKYYVLYVEKLVCVWLIFYFQMFRLSSFVLSSIFWSFFCSNFILVH